MPCYYRCVRPAEAFRWAFEKNAQELFSPLEPSSVPWGLLLLCWGITPSITKFCCCSWFGLSSMPCGHHILWSIIQLPCGTSQLSSRLSLWLSQLAILMSRKRSHLEQAASWFGAHIGTSASMPFELCLFAVAIETAKSLNRQTQPASHRQCPLPKKSESASWCFCANPSPIKTVSEPQSTNASASTNPVGFH